MALLHFTRLYITLHSFPSLYQSVHYHGSISHYISLPLLYFTLCDTILVYHCSTSLYQTQYWGPIALLHSTRLYVTLAWLYFTLQDSIHYSTVALIITLLDLHYCTMAQPQCTRLYITLPWLYFTLLDSILLQYGYTSLYQILHYCTMALLNFTSLYYGSTSLYQTLHYSTIALLHST